MRKLLFTFFALILCSATLLASNSKAPTSKTTTLSDFGWANDNKVLSFQVGVNSGDVVVSTETSTNQNGTYKTKNSTWRTYYADSEGPVSLTAGNNMWIKDVSFTLTAGVLSLMKGGTAEFDKTAVVTKDVSGTSKKWYTTNADGGCVGITKVVVNYYQIPTTITLTPASKFIKVGGSTAIAAVVAPETASDSLTWWSSDESIATVDNNGKVTGVSVGMVTIKATGIDKTINQLTTITVYPADGTYIEEKFSTVTKESGWKTGPNSIAGDNGVYGWSMANYNTSYTFGIGLRGKTGSIGNLKTDKDYEGGIKSVSFDWQPTTSGAIDYKVSVNGTQINCTSTTEASTTYYFAHSFNKVETNNNLSIDMNVSTTFLCVGRILITPYLLFTNKTPSVDCKDGDSFDLKTILIDNTTNANTVSYEVTSHTTGGATPTISANGLVDLSGVTSNGNVVVKASWGNVNTTTTLTVTALPAPTAIELNVPASMNATKGNRFQIIGTLKGDNANPNVEWSSSNDAIVSVDQNGMIDVLAAGDEAVTITLASKADPEIKATCTITAAANNDESFIEDYDGFGTWTETGKQTKTGKYSLGWIFRNSKLDGTTLLEAGVQGVQLQSGNNYIAYDNATSMEGGVKRVAFQWRAVTASDSVVFDVDDASASLPIYSTKLAANSDYANPQQYSRDVAYNENVFFRIRIASANSSKIIFGPITITPYLLYKTKLVTLTKDQVENTYKYKYTNDDIINNTGDNVAENFTYTISGPADADKIAIIKDEDKHTGQVTILGKGTVTVTATWGEVSTSYQLTISDLLTPSISVDESKTIDIYGSYTPKPVAKIGDEEIEGEFTFSSTVTSVIKNDLTVVGTGTTIIRSTLTGTGFYTTAEGSTTVTVTEPTDPNKYWKETFSSLTPVESTSYVTARTPVSGNDGVLDWYCRYFRRCTSGDKVNGEYGIRLNYNSETNNYIEYDGNQEGGIKYIFFNWRRPSAEKAAKVWVDITVTKGDETLASKAIRVENVAGGEGGQCSRSIKAKKNAKLMIEIPKDGADVPVIIGPITITPYLLYKTKTYAPTAAECAAANYKYTNKALINNTDKAINDTQTDIVFSIVGEDETTQKIAVIDEHTGQVTMRGAGTVTIQAKWGDVTTTYQLTVPTLTPTIELSQPAAIELDGTYTPAPKAYIGEYEITDAVFTYTDIDANVAKMVEGVIYPQSPGTTDVKAVLTATSSYASANTKVSLTVKDYTPEAGKSWPETFADIKKTSGWINEEKDIAGDQGLYNWKAYYHSHAYDFGKVCIRNYSTYRGYLKFNGNHEGGIKFFAFNWQPSTNTGGTVNYKVTVNGDEVSRQQSGLYTTETYRFAHFFNSIADESSLSIEMTDPAASNNTYLVIGDITIMPYLLYTRKAPAPTAEDLAAANYKYTNNDFINNTGVDLSNSAITFEIVGENEDTKKIATIDSNTGVVTCHGGGKVTVKATWKPDPNKADVVTTTYELTVPKLPAIVTYESASITVADTLPLPVAKCNGEVIKGAVYNYTTTDDKVIKVSDDQHSLIMVGKGTATITATLQESEQYQGATTGVQATIDIASAPANKCFVETFVNVPTPSETWETGTKQFDGVNNVYKWKIYNYSLKSTIILNQKVCIRNKSSVLGYLQMDGSQEGGIKFVEFDWQPSANGNIVSSITVNGTEEQNNVSGAQTTTTYHFAHCFNSKVNDLSIHMGAPSGAAAYLSVGAVTIVPYLLYTLKTKDIKIGEEYINNLIDNRDNATAIEYSIQNEADKQYVDIDGDGKVTGKKATPAETFVTIQAKWGEVITTYQVTVSKESSITLDEEKDNSILIAGYNDTEVATVNVIRKLSAGKYNTFCVPFEISKTDLQTALGTTITKLVTLDEDQPGALKDEGGQMNLNIAMKVVDDIEAGKPYLIEVAESVNSTITFSNVTIKDVGSDNFFQSSGTGNKVTFYGITSPYAIPSENKYLFMSNNRLSWNASGAAALMKGLRSYFHAEVENPNQVAARLVFNQSHTPTELMQNAECTMQGVQKVLINEQIYIIRNGVRYNVNGQMTK